MPLKWGSPEMQRAIAAIESGTALASTALQGINRVGADVLPEKFVVGRSTAGAVTCNGARVGDLVKTVHALNHAAAVIDRTANFLGVVAVINTINQLDGAFVGDSMRVQLNRRT